MNSLKTTLAQRKDELVAEVLEAAQL